MCAEVKSMSLTFSRPFASSKNERHVGGKCYGSGVGMVTEFDHLDDKEINMDVISR